MSEVIPLVVVLVDFVPVVILFVVTVTLDFVYLFCFCSGNSFSGFCFGCFAVVGVDDHC